MDVGCGGGFLLDLLPYPSRNKWCVEVNPTARGEAMSKGLRGFSSLEEVPKAAVTLAITVHSLEHHPHPLMSLQLIKERMRKNGLGIFIVPFHTGRKPSLWIYRPTDVHQHLYVWVPQAFGNLVSVAGFDVLECGFGEDKIKSAKSSLYEAEVIDSVLKHDNLNTYCVVRA